VGEYPWYVLGECHWYIIGCSVTLVTPVKIDLHTTAHDTKNLPIGRSSD
jgi:hypothetical protein